MGKGRENQDFEKLGKIRPSSRRKLCPHQPADTALLLLLFCYVFVFLSRNHRVFKLLMKVSPL